MMAQPLLNKTKNNKTPPELPTTKGFCLTYNRPKKGGQSILLCRKLYYQRLILTTSPLILA